MRTEPRLQQCRDTDIVECRSTTASTLPSSRCRDSNSSWLLEESMEHMLHCLEGSCRTNSADPSTSVNNTHATAYVSCELRALGDSRGVQSCCSSDRPSRSMGVARGSLEAGSGVDCCSRSTIQARDLPMPEESFLGELYRSNAESQSNPIKPINHSCQARRVAEHRTVVMELDGLERACSRETRRDGADETVARQTQRDHIAVRVARDAEPRLIAWQSGSPVGLRLPLESSSLSEQAHQRLCCV